MHTIRRLIRRLATGPGDNTLRLIVVWVVMVWATALLAVRVRAADDTAVSVRDAFGIQMLYPTRAGSRPWTSEHWAGRTYEITARLDPNDRQGISGKRGTGTLTVADGILTMGGEQPRIYIYPYTGAVWRDVELTVYYMRVADDATAFAGMVAGVRSGPEGHTTGMPCDAHTYYGRMRHDGAFDFAKELKHPQSAARGRVEPSQAWPDGQLPSKRWIGFKFISYNLGDTVKLEIHRDLTEGKDGGTWTKVIEQIDNGGWFARTDCPAHNPVSGRSDMRVLEGGTVLVRNTSVTEARYRWMSVREIQPP